MTPSRLKRLLAAYLSLSRITQAEGQSLSQQDGLAYQDDININTNPTTCAENLTSIIDAPHPRGWSSHNHQLCWQEYCVFSNREIAAGRGLVLVTLAESSTKLTRAIEENLRKIDTKKTNVQSAEIIGINNKKTPADGGEHFVAAKTLRRATHLMTLSPVLLAHAHFLEDAPASDRERLLEAAIELLPQPTRDKFNKQRTITTTTTGSSPRTISQILQQDQLILTPDFGADPHLANYPEFALFPNDCRPAASFHHHMNNPLLLTVTLARRLLPGDPVSISRLNPTLPRAARLAQAEKQFHHLRCACAHCTNLAVSTPSDARLQEIASLNSELLEDYRTKGVTAATVARYLALHDEEGLQSRLASAYWQAALNYSYLGMMKEAVRYANRAIQAGIIEWGPDANEIVAMRIFVDDPKGHYSWGKRQK